MTRPFLRPSRRVLRAFVRLRRATEGVAAVEFALILPLMLLLYLGSAETTQAVIAGRKAAVAARTVADLVAQTAASTSMTDAQMGSIFNGALVMMQPFPTASTTSTTPLLIDVSAVSFTQYTAAVSAALQPYVWVPTQSKLASAFTPTTTDPGYAAKVRWSVNPGTSGVSSNTSMTGVAAAATRTCGTGVNPLTPNTGAVASLDTVNLSTGLYGPTSLIIADIQYQYTPTFGATLVQIGKNASWAGSVMTTHETMYMQPRNATSVCSGSTDAYVCYTAQQTAACASY